MLMVDRVEALLAEELERRGENTAELRNKLSPWILNRIALGMNELTAVREVTGAWFEKTEPLTPEHRALLERNLKGPYWHL